LLLRNREQFPELSERIGSRFSGNGDLLGFAARRRNGQGDADEPPPIDPSYGPVITSCASFPTGISRAAGGQSGRGFFIQDAGFPHALNWAMRLTPGNLLKAGVAHSPELAKSMLNSLMRTILEYSPKPVRMLLEPLVERDQTDISLPIANIMRLMSQEEWMPLLGMGQDTPDGHIRLDDDGRLAEVDWERHGSQAYYDDLRLAMRAIADAMGADFINSMSWPLRRAITVHPLGGCPFGRNADEGVVDLYGEVFRGERRYDGFFIADGSVMPGPVGANPSLTIAALAHRFAGKVIQNHKRRG
jgi:cholesterol oxidase